MGLSESRGACLRIRRFSTSHSSDLGPPPNSLLLNVLLDLEEGQARNLHLSQRLVSLLHPYSVQHPAACKHGSTSCSSSLMFERTHACIHWPAYSDTQKRQTRETPQTDRQTDGRTDRQTDRPTDRQRHTDTQTETDRHTETHRHTRTETDRDRQRQTRDRRETERQRDRGTDRQTDKQDTDQQPTSQPATLP